MYFLNTFVQSKQKRDVQFSSSFSLKTCRTVASNKFSTRTRDSYLHISIRSMTAIAEKAACCHSVTNVLNRHRNLQWSIMISQWKCWKWLCSVTSEWLRSSRLSIQLFKWMQYHGSHGCIINPNGFIIDRYSTLRSRSVKPRAVHRKIRNTLRLFTYSDYQWYWIYSNSRIIWHGFAVVILWTWLRGRTEILWREENKSLSYQTK